MSGNGFTTAGGFTGQAASRPADRTATGRHPSGGEGTVGLTETMTAALRAAQPKEVALTLLAEWALWGKDERNTGYHVMRCSNGDLTGKDFAEIITRYGSGVKPSLPQYTVCWIPGPQGQPEFLAVAIHEVIEPGMPSTGNRKRNVGGRVVEYVRMFCFRYADVAEFGSSYTDLVAAVADIPLLEGQTQLIPVELPSGPEPAPPSGAERQLAEEVALRLMTGSPVCILDGGALLAAQRLGFIDHVLSLLPFGLRATLSASTSASPTMQDLKLRLYFSSAPREDGGRTSHVSWGRPAHVQLGPGHDAARLYQEWLREAGPGAIGALVEQTDPVRFTETDELEMLNKLPNDRSVADTLAELSDKLDAADGPAVSARVKRLQRYLAGPRDLAERTLYGPLILKHGLFREHSGIHGSVKSSLYRTLLTLGFRLPLSYADYAEIEQSAGGPPGWALRQVLMDNRSSSSVYILAGLAGSGIGRDQVREALSAGGIDAFSLLDSLAIDVDAIRSQQHRRTLIDFTLWYLWTPVDLYELWQGQYDPRTELHDRGYLSGLLARAFPKDLAEQQDRLVNVLQYVYGERIAPGQIRNIFAAPALSPSPAFQAAVTRLVQPQHKRLVERSAAETRLRLAGHDEDVKTLMQSPPRRIPRPMLPRPAVGREKAGLVFAVVAGVLIAVAVVLVLYVAMARH